MEFLISLWDLSGRGRKKWDRGAPSLGRKGGTLALHAPPVQGDSHVVRPVICSPPQGRHYHLHFEVGARQFGERPLHGVTQQLSAESCIKPQPPAHKSVPFRNQVLQQVRERLVRRR